jgi:hypothetical protein
MIVDAVQRWRSRRESYRPAGEPIATRLYEVATIPDDTTAKRFVVEHHYEHKYPAALERFGLYRGGELVGVTVFSQPANNLVLEQAPGTRRAELGRLVLLDEVPANGESFFIARCFELLRRDGYEGIVSYSDPMPRDTAAGRIIFGGHAGVVYQATNGTYLGLSPPHTVRLAADGSVIGNRTLSKIRSMERGWRYAVDQLVALGAAEPEGDLRAWLRAELPRISRTRRSQGKHRYVWAIDRRLRKHLPASKPFPKMTRS